MTSHHTRQRGATVLTLTAASLTAFIGPAVLAAVPASAAARSVPPVVPTASAVSFQGAVSFPSVVPDASAVSFPDAVPASDAVSFSGTVPAPGAARTVPFPSAVPGSDAVSFEGAVPASDTVPVPGAVPTPSAIPLAGAVPNLVPLSGKALAAEPSDGTEDPGMFDIPGQVRKALTDFLAWAVRSALNPVLGALGKTLLSTPDLTANEQVKTIWTVSLVTANAIFGLLLLAGAFTVASHQSLQSSYGLKEVAPRLAAGAVLANISLLLCGKALVLTDAVCASIAGQGVDPHAAAEAIMQTLTAAIHGVNFLVTLLVLGALVMAIVVMITFILRIVFLVILIGLAPLALICHALPQTESLAYTWWRGFAACLGIQLAQAVILLASVRVFLTPKGVTVLGLPAGPDALIGVLVCLTMLWLLIKVPGWMRQFVLGPLGQRGGRGLLGQILHAYLSIKTLGAAAGLLRGAGAAGTAATAARRATATAARSTTSRPTRPSPARPSRARPAPVGPVAFSHAPAAQTPLPAAAGSSSAPAFSSPSRPATPQAASGGVPAAQFSHPTPSQPAVPTPATPPTPIRFSGTPTTASAPAHAPGPSAPLVAFSSAAAPQAAPKRPPAPVTPVFSSARPASTASRPTAARRPPARSSRPPAPTPRPVPVPVPGPRSVPGPRPEPAARTVSAPRAVSPGRSGPVPPTGAVPGPRVVAPSRSTPVAPPTPPARSRRRPARGDR